MMTRQRMGTAVLLLALAACGGGGGDAATRPVVTDSVPDAASASAAGMAQWLSEVAATQPDDREPLAAAAFAPPQPDDTEPVALR